MAAHTFDLYDASREAGDRRIGDPAYAALLADLPHGCSVDETNLPWLGLICTREADSRLAAVGGTIVEIRDRFGLSFDMGIEKPHAEFNGDDPDSAADTVAQLALLAVDRAALAGIDPEEIVRLVRTIATGSGT